MPVALAVDGVIGITILFVCLSLILLRFGWQMTMSPLLVALARVFEAVKVTIPIPFHSFTLGLQSVGHAIRGIDRQMLRVLGEGINSTQAAAITLWHWTAYLLESTGRVIGDLAEWTYGELRDLERVVIPPLIHAVVHPIASKVEWIIHHLEHLATSPTTIVEPVRRIIDPRIKTLEHQVNQLAHAVASIGPITLAPPITVTPHLPAGIRHGIDQIRDQLGRITRVLTPAGVIGLVAAAVLSQLDLGWLKCRGVGRAGKALCGASGLLETLASDAIDALIVADLCAFVGALSYAVHEFQPALEAFTSVENALIGCHGATLPADLTVPALSLPPRAALVLG